MLSREQLRQINASIEGALQVSMKEPSGLLRHLLEMASLEISQRVKSQPDRMKDAA